MNFIRTWNLPENSDCLSNTVSYFLNIRFSRFHGLSSVCHKNIKLVLMFCPKREMTYRLFHPGRGPSTPDLWRSYSRRRYPPITSSSWYKKNKKFLKSPGPVLTPLQDHFSLVLMIFLGSVCRKNIQLSCTKISNYTL